MRTRILWCLAALALSATARAGVVQAAHEGVWDADQMHWQVNWQVESDSTEVRFLEGLPEGTELTWSAYVMPVLQEDRIVGFRMLPHHQEGSVQLVLDQPLGTQGLTAPLLDTAAPQRIVVRGASFAPDEMLGLEKHVRYWAAPGLGGSARHDFEHRWTRRSGLRAKTRDQAVYLRRATVKSVRIPGTLSEPGTVGVGVHVALAALAGVLGLLGWGLFRGLDATARREQNDAYIRSHFTGGASEEEEQPAC